MWSSINIRCTRLSNMVSALIIVLLRNEIKLLWRNHETQQGKNNGSKFYYRAFLSHTDSFTLSYPYLFTWNVTLYKILLWLKVRRRPNYNLSIAAHMPHTEMQCHKHLVRIGSRTPGSMSGCLNLHVPHSMEWVESVLFQIVHISFSQKLVSYLFWLSWHSLLRNGERVAFFSHQFYELGCDLIFSSSFKVEIF